MPGRKKNRSQGAGSVGLPRVEIAGPGLCTAGFIRRSLIKKVTASAMPKIMPQRRVLGKQSIRIAARIK